LPEPGVPEVPTVPVQRPGLSTEIVRQLEDTPHPAVRAVYARVPLAVTAMAGRRGAFPRAEVPAWVGEARVVVEAGMAVGAGGGNRSGSWQFARL
jgi:hypothetical protein